MSIKAEHLNYIYSPGTAYEKQALKDICLEIPHGEFVGIIGHTGSGKSTLIQHFNGLMRATSGKLYYNGEDIYADGYNRKNLRNQVGLVFQYPEHQLFEVDVMTDVCFGPKNQGLSSEECKARAREALKLVGLKEKYYGSSPFELSGGQKRRVAIAGVLAMRPKVLVLDEPTGGLDPLMQKEFFDILRERNKEGTTVFLSSHVLSEIQRNCTRAAIIRDGKIIACDSVEVLSKTSAKRITVHGSVSLERLDGIRDRKDTEETCSFLYSGDMNSLLRALSAGQVEDLTITEPDLEEVFLHYYEKDGETV